MAQHTAYLAAADKAVAAAEAAEAAAENAARGDADALAEELAAPDYLGTALLKDPARRCCVFEGNAGALCLQCVCVRAYCVRVCLACACVTIYGRCGSVDNIYLQLQTSITGDAMVMDSRILHCGSANLSTGAHIQNITSIMYIQNTTGILYICK